MKGLWLRRAIRWFGLTRCAKPELNGLTGCMLSVKFVYGKMQYICIARDER